MRKFTTILVALFATVITIFSSCKSNIDYNETVVKIHDHYIAQLETAFADIDADEAQNLEAINKVSSLTDSCLEVLNKLEPSKDAQNFHNAIIDFYTCVKADIIPVYTKLATFKDTVNEEAVLLLSQEFETATTKLEELEIKAQDAQVEFAKKVNMKLEK